MLYNTYTASYIPFIVHEADAGNFTPFVAVSERFKSGGLGEFAGLHFSMICAESLPFITALDIQQQTAGTFIGQKRVKAYQTVCNTWPHAEVPRTFLKNSKIKVPILIFEGEDDGVTPPEVSARTTKLWSQSRVVRIPNSGHQLDSSCQYQIINDFFQSGSAKNLNTACVGNTHRPPFKMELQ